MNAAARIVITGATSGLGEGLALSYAAPGASLGLIGRNAERLRQAALACQARGATVHAGQIDLRDHAGLASFLTRFDDDGPIDLLIANAGISGGTLTGEAVETPEAAMRLVETNLLGTIATIAPILPRMLARQRGAIALVASVAALRGLPDSPGYCASKAGVRAYGESLRACLTPLGIKVSVIVPGFFDSPMTDRFLGGHPLKLSRDAAVRHVRRGLDRGASRIVFPRLLALGLQAADLLPAPIGDWIIRHSRFHYDR